MFTTDNFFSRKVVISYQGTIYTVKEIQTFPAYLSLDTILKFHMYSEVLPNLLLEEKKKNKNLSNISLYATNDLGIYIAKIDQVEIDFVHDCIIQAFIPGYAKDKIEQIENSPIVILSKKVSLIEKDPSLYRFDLED